VGVPRADWLVQLDAQWTSSAENIDARPLIWRSADGEEFLIDAAYERLAALTRHLDDAPIELDAHRLASLCRSQLSAASAVWETERHSAYTWQRRPPEERFVKLLGAEWRDAVLKAG
jgi:hypothetical protein